MDAHRTERNEKKYIKKLNVNKNMMKHFKRFVILDMKTMTQKKTGKLGKIEGKNKKMKNANNRKRRNLLPLAKQFSMPKLHWLPKIS